MGTIDVEISATNALGKRRGKMGPDGADFSTLNFNHSICELSLVKNPENWYKGR